MLIWDSRVQHAGSPPAAGTGSPRSTFYCTMSPASWQTAQQVKYRQHAIEKHISTGHRAILNNQRANQQVKADKRHVMKDWFLPNSSDYTNGLLPATPSGNKDIDTFIPRFRVKSNDLPVDRISSVFPWNHTEKEAANDFDMPRNPIVEKVHMKNVKDYVKKVNHMLLL